MFPFRKVLWIVDLYKYGVETKRLNQNLQQQKMLVTEIYIFLMFSKIFKIWRGEKILVYERLMGGRL